MSLRQVQWVAIAAAVFMLAGCAETQLLFHTAKRVGQTAEKTPAGIKYKIGSPYQIKGVWYYPKENWTYDKTGVASWYGPGFHGKKTANGETYDMNGVSAAHRTLPLPSIVRVTNLENGRELELRINDRGPYAHGRIIDLSRRAAQLLGVVRSGTAKVRVRIIADKSRALARGLSNQQVAKAGDTPITVKRLPKERVASVELAPPPPSTPTTVAQPTVAAPPVPEASPIVIAPPAALPVASNSVSTVAVADTRLFVQAGAFSRFDNAYKVQAMISRVGKVKVTSVIVNGVEFFRVRVGPIATVTDADTALERVIKAGYPGARLIVD